MLRKILLAVTMVFALVNFAFAGVDVNSADKTALDGIKSIGPKTADAIIAERTKNGKFKDWSDFIHRVKGVGPKNAEKMSGAGLTVNGDALANAPAVAAEKTTKKMPKAEKGAQPAPAAPAAAAPADKKAVAIEPAAAPKDEKKKEKK
jgi:competence protein ComEA